jgi:hypothetical protein
MTSAAWLGRQLDLPYRLLRARPVVGRDKLSVIMEWPGMGGCLVRKIAHAVPGSLCMTRVDNLLLAATQIDSQAFKQILKRIIA